MLAAAESAASTSWLPMPGEDYEGSASLGAEAEYATKAYTGREWDRETGLYYYRARYYDPKAGRFISEDPIGLAGGINMYAYANGNPTLFVDPMGLAAGEARASIRGNVLRPGQRERELVQGFTDLVMVGMVFVPGPGEARLVQQGIREAKACTLSPGTLGEALRRQLASEAQIAELLAGEGEVIAGNGAKKLLRDAERLAAQYGGKAEDWAKVRSSSYQSLLDGLKMEIHAYRNTVTGAVEEFKTKINW